ncbi:MAG: hypothetical protein J2P18_24070 [Nocardia sp.]|nr:hypothetical protein [Nocardia sp.]
MQVGTALWTTFALWMNPGRTVDDQAAEEESDEAPDALDLESEVLPEGFGASVDFDSDFADSVADEEPLRLSVR